MQIQHTFSTPSKNTSFQALKLKDGVNYSQMFPDNVYVDVIRNKEIQKLAAEYALCGEDVVVRYENSPATNKALKIYSEAKNANFPKEIARVSYDNLENFKADKYIEKPRAKKFLEEFNKSIEKFSHKVNSTVDKIIDEFGK